MKFNTAKTVLILTVVFIFLTITRAQAAPGDLDPSFGSGGKVVIPANTVPSFVRVQADGKIMTIGAYPYGGTAYISRSNANGTADTSFGSNGLVLINLEEVYELFNDFIMLPDGKYLITGVKDNSRALFRYNSNGTRDTSFGTNGVLTNSLSGEAIALQSDGRVITGGYTIIDGVGKGFLVRYNTDGTLDDGFGENGMVLSDDSADKIMLQPDGKLLVLSRNASDRYQITRYNSNGTRDNNFGTNGVAQPPAYGVAAMGIQSNGKIIFGSSIGQTSVLERYNENGTPDTAFGTNGTVRITDTSNNQYSLGIVRSLAIQRNNKILTAGSVNGIFSVYRFDPNGGLDATFGTNGLVTTQMSPICRLFDITLQPDGKIVAVGDTGSLNSIQYVGLVRYLGDNVVQVTNIEELYSAVNNPQNAGSQIVMAPGVYMLSVNAPGGIARPNAGRLELQENMSLQGIVGTRDAVIIDAINLPASSYSAPPITNTAPIRMGKGSNSIEWLTVRNGLTAQAGIETDLNLPGTTYIRIAHIISTNNARGIDVRNFGATAANRIIQAEIIDNDVYNNRIGTLGEGLRLVNNLGADNAVVTATLSGNRSYNNYNGFIIENNRSNNSNVTVFSSGDRFFENGFGAIVGAGLSSNSTVANGNTTNFTASGDSFENNNGFSNFDIGGLIISGGENTSIPNGTSNNTVNVELRNCRFANNQLHDIAAFGARSNPASVGMPGTNNRVRIKLLGTIVPVFETTDSLPDDPAWLNSVTVTRSTPFDFDGDGKSDVSVWRENGGIWFVTNSSATPNAQFQFGQTGDRIVPGDYDGDGKTDYAVWRPSTGVWYLQQSSNGFKAFQFGLPTDLPVQGDFDGDGKTDIAVWRPSTGTWYLQQSTAGLSTVQFGQAGDKPVAGDYDGDGKTDIAVFRPSNSTWYLLRSTLGFTAIQFGIPTDKVVPADYDGDGKTDIAVYRDGSAAVWFIRPSSAAAGYTATQFGTTNDIPTAGDFDGDGKADISVFRPSNGIWFRLNSRSNSSFSATQYGQNGDKPIPAGYVPVQ